VQCCREQWQVVVVVVVLITIDRVIRRARGIRRSEVGATDETVDSTVARNKALDKEVAIREC